MTSLLLYKEIRALNRDEHRALRLRPAQGCEYAAHTHLVPLAGAEFAQAARHYPILFIGEGGQPMPVALLGLAKERNDFLDAQGQWRSHTYVPAFVRRYPFVLTQHEGDFTVCFDAAYTGWNEREGRELFDASGKNSAFLEEMIQFLQNFTLEMERTRAFVTQLSALHLLQSRTLQLNHHSGEHMTLRDVLTVDAQRLGELPDTEIAGLQRSGHLAWIHAHLLSLGNLDALFDDYLARR